METPPPDTADRRPGPHALRLALEAARAGAWEWELSSNLAFWSPENYALMGLPPGPGQATYDEWLARVHPDDRERAQASVAAAVESKGDLDFVYRAVWPDGTVRWLRDIGRMMFDEAGKPIGMYGIQVDVTEQRELEDRLRQSERIEAMGRVAGVVAHDFNNLLTVIIGNGQFLADDPRLDREQQTTAREILQAAERAGTLTQRLLAFGRGQLLQPRLLDLNRLLTERERPWLQSLGEDITVTLRLAADLPCVKADVGQIEHVILNIVVNARDAMPTGGHLLVETLVVDDAASPFDESPPVAERWVGVRVRDTGCGMDEDTMARIFDPFFTTKPTGRGTGLGLSSVQGILAQSGGRLTVDSSPGKGTTFAFYLPAVEGREHAGDAGDAMADDRGSETVLVVEDESAIRDLVTASLASRGYRVRSAASAEHALELMERDPTAIDVLVTDVVLPQLPGPALAERLARHYPQLCVVFTTGWGMDAVGTHGVPENAAVLHKPFTLPDLVRQVRRVLDQRPPAR